MGTYQPRLPNLLESFCCCSNTVKRTVLPKNSQEKLNLTFFQTRIAQTISGNWLYIT